MYNIDSFTSLSRLVKGKLTPNEETNDELIINAKRLESLIVMGYNRLVEDRNRNERVNDKSYRMIKGAAASSARRTNAAKFITKRYGFDPIILQTVHHLYYR